MYRTTTQRATRARHGHFQPRSDVSRGAGAALAERSFAFPSGDELTRLRLQSAREGGAKHQLTLTESVNNSTTRQSEVTATARRKTKNAEEENTSWDSGRAHVSNSNPATKTVSFVTYNIYLSEPDVSSLSSSSSSSIPQPRGSLEHHR